MVIMELTTLNIQNIMDRDPLVKDIFKGVFACDMLPRLIIEKPASLIINLDPHYEPGSHWVAAHFPREGFALFFDSFGISPCKEEIVAFFDTNSKYGWYFNPYQY